VISWVHIDDVVNLFLYALENKAIEGIYNAVAPNPVSNEKLIKSMAKGSAFHITAPVPSFVLKAMLGEMSIEILKSTTVSSRKIENTGYSFLFPDIDTATFNLNKKAC
jgi:NAD dependent epimerase/dehydratase family enzyme